MIHPARAMPFTDLVAGLEARVADGLVNKVVSGDLTLYNYSQETQHGKHWDEYTMVARGLILSHDRVIATPFPKFFNYSECHVPDLPFETFEKLDGSLIILYFYDGWKTATRGSFTSEQATWAASEIQNYDLTPLDPYTTYLFEAIGPNNQIVVRYDDSELVLLGAYDGDGAEVSYGRLMNLSCITGFPLARRIKHESIDVLLSLVKEMSADREGFVIRFSNGLRVKLKGDAYCRVHKIVSHVTPLAIWESLAAGEDMENICEQLPDEFQAEFSRIVLALTSRFLKLHTSAWDVVVESRGLTDKELGIRLHTIPENIRSFVFPIRKYGCAGADAAIWRAIRPNHNLMEGI